MEVMEVYFYFIFMYFIFILSVFLFYSKAYTTSVEVMKVYLNPCVSSQSFRYYMYKYCYHVDDRGHVLILHRAA